RSTVPSAARSTRSTSPSSTLFAPIRSASSNWRSVNPSAAIASPDASALARASASILSWAASSAELPQAASARGRLATVAISFFMTEPPGQRRFGMVSQPVGCAAGSELERIAVAIAVDFAAADVVGRANQTLFFHPLDPLGGGVVAHAHLPLQPRTRCLLRFEHDLAGLAVLAFLWVVAGGELLIEAEEAAFLGLLGHRIDVFRGALAAPVLGDAFDFLVADERPVHAAQRAGARLVEHVALAQQLLGALLAQDRAAVDAARHVEADPGRQVGLDDAGDDVDRRPLRRHDQVDARSAALLAEPLDQHFDLLADRHHQVVQLVDDQHDLRQHCVIELLLLDQFLAGFGVEPGLDAAAERLALRNRGFHLVVEAVEVAHADIAHHP